MCRGGGTSQGKLMERSTSLYEESVKDIGRLEVMGRENVKEHS